MPNANVVISDIPGITPESSALQIYESLSGKVPPEMLQRLGVCHTGVIYPLTDFLNFIVGVTDQETKREHCCSSNRLVFSHRRNAR